ncbi:hypothetical protein CEXT_220671 [Caerostris extrusa]|uniref:Uncharacterized protein n=1 Tax=Caerostris extrusa TaxID=172846 RepID=A0AAV4VMK2_CAEEX|nr:hypothetical protein CEXT_220671 [Caerostris extrusa]
MKDGTSMIQVSEEPLKYLDLYSRSERRDQTALARLSTGHLKTLRYFHRAKKFPDCTKCGNEKVTPQHLTTCVNLLREDLLNSEETDLCLAGI